MMNLTRALKRILPKSYRDCIKRSKAYHAYRFLQLRKTLLHTPKGITIELTDRCNLRCSYCPKGRGIGLEGGDVDFELFKAIVDEAAALEAEQICLVGFGEPLLYSHLIEAIRYIKSKHPLLRTYLTTNGILLGAQMSKALIDSGLDQMTISVNFVSSQKYRELNNADAFEKVVENTKIFLQLLNQGNCDRTPKARIQILDELNFPSEIAAFREFWGPFLGSNAIVQIQPLVNWAGQIPIEQKRKEDRERYPCIHLQNSWIVTREGNALGCCMVFPCDEGNELVLGRIESEESLKRLYFEGKIMQMRKLNLNCDYEQMPTCKRCDAYQSVPNIFLRNPLHRIAGTKWL